MKKTLSREIIICDFCTVDTDAIEKCEPTGKDVCGKHLIRKEVRFPKEFENEMSGKHIIIDPDYADKEVIFKVVIK
jgi:hypothetical protein